MAYQKILLECYLENNKFCNIMKLLSDELGDYSRLIENEESVLSGYVLQLSQIYLQYAQNLQNCITNNSSIINRKMQAGELVENILTDNFVKERDELEELIQKYIDNKIEIKLVKANINRFNKADVLAFVDKCEEAEYEGMLRSICAKYSSIVDQSII